MGMKRNGRRGPVRICLMGLAAAGTVWGAAYMIKQQSRPYGGSLGAAGSDGRGRTGSASVASGCAL